MNGFFKKTVAFLLSMVFALMSMGSFALSEEEEAALEDPVILSIDGKEISLSEIQNNAGALLAYGYIASQTDYESVMKYVLSSELQMLELSALGFDVFTQDEEEAFLQEAQTEYEEMLEYYFALYQSSEDMTETETEAQKNEIASFLEANGYTVEAVADNLKYSAMIDRLIEYMKERGNISVSEEEIRQIFEEYVQQDEALYEDNIFQYEINRFWYGEELWYTPEGYRGILLIKLAVDEELLNALETAQAVQEEEEEEETTDEKASASPEEVKKSILENAQETIDEIYARLGAGETFVSLIAAYNTDSMMEDEETLQNGLMVHQDSFYLEDTIVEAAFDENMQSPGDVSQPHVGTGGIYIAYYLRDVPGGAIEITDAIRAEIQEYLEEDKLDTFYEELLLEWMKTHEIEYNIEAMEQYLSLTVENGEIVSLTEAEE